MTEKVKKRARKPKAEPPPVAVVEAAKPEAERPVVEVSIPKARDRRHWGNDNGQ